MLAGAGGDLKNVVPMAHPTRSPALRRRLGWGVLTAALAGGPARAAAQTEPSTTTGDSTGDSTGDPLADTRDLYRKGQGAFEAKDYERALELFADALGAMPDDPQYLNVRRTMLYNVALTYEKIHEFTADRSYLARARALYREVVGASESGSDPDSLDASRRIAGIDALLAEEDRHGKKRRTPRPARTARDNDGPGPAPGIALLTVGAAALAVGVTTLGVAASLTGRGEDTIDRELGPESGWTEADANYVQTYRGQVAHNKRTTMIAGALVLSVGAVAAAVGAGLLAKTKRAGRTAWRVRPAVARRFAGVHAEVRF